MKKDVIKPRAAIQIANGSLTLIQRQLWNILFAKAFDKLKEEQRYSVTEKDLLSYFPYETRNTKHLKECLTALVGTVIQYNILENEEPEWGAFTMLSHAKLKKGICSYSFDIELKERLLDPRIYAKISLMISQRFSSKYALILYEIGIDYHKINRTPLFNLSEIRDLLGIKKNEYPRYNNFNARVLKPALEEINDKSDLILSAHPERTGRKITHIQFLISKKDNFQIDLFEFAKDNEEGFKKLQDTVKSSPGWSKRASEQDLF